MDFKSEKKPQPDGSDFRPELWYKQETIEYLKNYNLLSDHNFLY